MKDIAILLSCANLISGKLSFTSYRSKCSRPIRLQYSLMINISEKNTLIFLIFCVEIFTKKR